MKNLKILKFEQHWGKLCVKIISSDNPLQNVFRNVKTWPNWTRPDNFDICFWGNF